MYHNVQKDFLFKKNINKYIIFYICFQGLLSVLSKPYYKILISPSFIRGHDLDYPFLRSGVQI